MPKGNFPDIDTKNIETPCFVIDEETIKENLKILQHVQKEANCKILLALKAYAIHPTFSLIRETLNGVCAGSLYEAKIGREEFGKEVHTYSPAFKEDEFSEALSYSDFIIFNSVSQFKKFAPIIESTKKNVKIGLRVNAEKSVAGILFNSYDPSAENSRLGITSDNLQATNLDGISGLHFHALCEQGADELEVVLNAFQEKFDSQIRKMK